MSTWLWKLCLSLFGVQLPEAISPSSQQKVMNSLLFASKLWFKFAFWSKYLYFIQIQFEHTPTCIWTQEILKGFLACRGGHQAGSDQSIVTEKTGGICVHIPVGGVSSSPILLTWGNVSQIYSRINDLFSHLTHY